MRIFPIPNRDRSLLTGLMLGLSLTLTSTAQASGSGMPCEHRRKRPCPGDPGVDAAERVARRRPDHIPQFG